MKNFKPVYLRAFKEGNLRNLRLSLEDELKACRLCPRNCSVNRYESTSGKCNTGNLAVVSSVSPHFGEERPLVGYSGSGTIFFSHCNLLCNFCQNFDISHEGEGKEVSSEELAGMMLYLQSIGCHNINFVTPSHVVAQIISALEIAVESGLSIPLVYNSSAYDSVETIRKLDGIIDIYMPDLKFLDSHLAGRTCQAEDYPDIARKVISEMYRQVGELSFDENGIAQRGLLIRHLVMPGKLEDTKEVLRFIVQKVSKKTWVNVMPQYRPAGDLSRTPELDRPLFPDEYEQAVSFALQEGLTNLF
jgi:putative pyruvate formate lyase activating enzyme